MSVIPVSGLLGIRLLPADDVMTVCWCGCGRLTSPSPSLLLLLLLLLLAQGVRAGGRPGSSSPPPHHPLLQSSTHSMAATAGRVMMRAITMCADVAGLLQQPQGSSTLRTYRPAASSRSWIEAKSELEESMAEAVQLYWSAVAAAHHHHHHKTGAQSLQQGPHQQGLKVASSKEVRTAEELRQCRGCAGPYSGPRLRLVGLDHHNRLLITLVDCQLAPSCTCQQSTSCRHQSLRWPSPSMSLVSAMCCCCCCCPAG